MFCPYGTKSIVLNFWYCGEHELSTDRDQINSLGRVTYICVGNLTIISSDNGLSPGRRQAIIWTHAGYLLIGPLGTNFSRNSYILIQENTFEIVVREMSGILF